MLSLVPITALPDTNREGNALQHAVGVLCTARIGRRDDPDLLS